VKGHLPKREVKRVAAIFAKARPEQTRILVMHHNLLRGSLSQRMGLARWRKAQRRVLGSGADLVLCGHDHQEQVDMLDDRILVSCANTLSSRSRGGKPSTFHRISIDDESFQVEMFRWEASRRVFRRSDVFAFARPQRKGAASNPPEKQDAVPPAN